MPGRSSPMVDGDTFEVWPEEAETGDAVHSVAVPAPAVAPVSAWCSTPPASVARTVKTKAVARPHPRGDHFGQRSKKATAISFGQELCVLEAMKMKNLIRANRGGKIGAIRVAAGDQVKHSQVLMEFTD